MDITKVLAAFKNVVQTSPLTWKASCPAHKDDRPSLSITLQHNRILLHCHAGCLFKEVTARAGLKNADLRVGKQSTANAIIATYDYYDEKGRLLYQVCRTTDKGFFQRHLGPDHEWIHNLKGIDRVLYRLPELVAAKGARVVFVVEGEKDVDRLHALGFLATCNSGGAGKWHSYYNEYLKGRHAVVIADNDAPGRKHAETISKALQGTAATVRVLQLPGLKEHGDVSDWLSSGKTVEDLRSLVSKTPTVGEQPSATPSAISATDLVGLDLPPVNFIVPNLIPEGLTLFAGRPKVGKSWLCLDLAIAVAAGGYVLGAIEVAPHEVLYLALEDNLRRLQSRLKTLLGIDPPPLGLSFNLEWPRLDVSSGGLLRLNAWVRAHPACRLIIIDTLARVKPTADRNSQVYDADTHALAGLQNLAGQNGLAIIIVHHTRKADADNPLDAVSGTLALTGVADTTLILKRASTRAKGELFVTGRDVNEQNLALSWGEEHPTWTILGDAEEYAISEQHQQVLQLLDEAEGPMTPSGIAEVLELKSNVVHKLLSRMMHKGEIKKIDRGKYVRQSKSNTAETPKREPTFFDAEDEN